MTRHLIVLAGFWTVMCTTFAVAGWICDPGGLWDRAVARRQARTGGRR